MARFITVSSLLFLFALTLYPQSKTIRVPQDHATIQAAIDAAVNGDTVLVDEGTYFVNLLLTKKIVLGSRYITDHDTAHISRTILDGASPRHVDSGSVILAIPGTDTMTVICGFTITHGSGTRLLDRSGTSWLVGGGILAYGNGITVAHNRIVNNQVTPRGGINYTAGGGVAAGWLLGSNEYSIITDNIIADNTVTGIAADGAGLGFATRGRIERNIIEHNVASSTMSSAAVGGVSLGSPAGHPVLVRANIIRGNISNQSGGGVAIYRPTSAGGPVVTMINNLIVLNTAVTFGGAIDLRQGCALTLINNTIADNDGAWGSGLFVRGSTPSTLSRVVGFNNIFWNKRPSLSEIYHAPYGSLHHNLIQGFSLFGDNNFSTDPGFVPDGSYALAPGSPCIAAGTSGRAVLGEVLQAPGDDLLGASRSQPGGTPPDIGAIESELGTTTALRPASSEGRTFVFEGRARTYAVRRPPGRESEQNLGILLMLHGYGGDASSAMNEYRADITGDSLGYLTVHPDAYAFRWNSGIGDNPEWPTPTTDDVGFISALIDSLHVQYGADTNRVFVMGHSNGAVMTYRLALQLSRRIRRAAAVAGVIPVSIAHIPAGAIHIPILIMNGTNDPTVTYATSPTGWNTVPFTLEFWRTWTEARAGGDTYQMPNSDLTDGSTVERQRFIDANGRRMVWFYKVNGGGHDWPGESYYPGQFNTNRDIHASREIIEFLTDSLTGRTADLSRLQIDFGNRMTMTGDTTRLTVANPSSAPFTITGARELHAPFTVVRQPILPLTLPPGASCEIHVAFHPTQAVASVDTLVLDATGVGDSMIRIPMSGKGLDAIVRTQRDSIYVVQQGSLASGLYTIPLPSLSPSRRGSLGAGTIRSIAIDPVTGTLYGVGSSSVSSTLFRISTDVGSAVPSVAIPLTEVEAITFGTGGVLYAGTRSGQLYRIDLPSGSATPIGTGTGLSLTALTFDNISGKLWAASLWPNDSLVVIDPATNDRQPKAALPYGSPVRALTFNGLGTLYALIDNGYGEFYFSTINTATGEPTLLSEFPIPLGSPSGIAVWGLEPTDGREIVEEQPVTYALDQNYPNPFNPATEIGYRMKERGWARVSVSNMLGQEVAVLVNEERSAGTHRVSWNAQGMASGVYFYRMTVSSVNGQRYDGTKRMVLLK